MQHDLNEGVRGAATLRGGEGRLSDAEILTRLGDLLRAVPDATPDTVELQGDPTKGPDIEAAIEAHWRCGQPPFTIEVEVAPDCSTSGLDPESIRGASLKATVRALVERVRLRNPKTKLYPKARVRWPAALFLRARVSPRRAAILAFYSTHKPTLQRLVAQHGVGSGWQQAYQHVWRQDNGNGMVVDLKGARAWHHTHTFQAGVVGSFLRDEHAPFPKGELDGLEAALLCDYCCARCKGDALGMIDAMLAKSTAMSPTSPVLTKPLSPRIKSGSIKHRLLLDAADVFPEPLDVVADSIAAGWRQRGGASVGTNKIDEARARLRDAGLLTAKNVLTDLGREECERLGPLPRSTRRK